MKKLLICLLVVSAMPAFSSDDFSVKNLDAKTITKLNTPTITKILSSFLAEVKAILTYTTHTENSSALVQEYLACFGENDLNDMSSLKLLEIVEEIVVIHKKHTNEIDLETDASLAFTADLLINKPNTLAARNVYFIYAIYRMLLLPLSISDIELDAATQSKINALSVLQYPTNHSLDEVKQALSIATSSSLKTKDKIDTFKELYISSLLKIKLNIQNETQE